MDKEKEILQKARNFCSRKEVCSAEILAKMKQWDADTEQCEKALALLKNEGYIDDLRYACAYAGDKLKLNKWGRIKIRYMLRQKGINQAGIEAAIGEFDDKEYESILKTELEKKRKQIKSKNQWEIRGKLMQFAAGRGFETDLTNSLISVLLKTGKE